MTIYLLYQFSFPHSFILFSFILFELSFCKLIQPIYHMLVLYQFHLLDERHYPNELHE